MTDQEVRLLNRGWAVVAYRVGEDGKREMIDAVFNKWHPRYWLQHIELQRQDIRRRISGFFWRHSKWHSRDWDRNAMRAEINGLKKRVAELEKERMA